MWCKVGNIGGHSNRLELSNPNNTKRTSNSPILVMCPFWGIPEKLRGWKKLFSGRFVSKTHRKILHPNVYSDSCSPRRDNSNDPIQSHCWCLLWWVVTTFVFVQKLHLRFRNQHLCHSAPPCTKHNDSSITIIHHESSLLILTAMLFPETKIGPGFIFTSSICRHSEVWSCSSSGVSLVVKCIDCIVGP